MSRIQVGPWTWFTLAACILLMILPSRSRAGRINVWCIDDMAKIDPTTGKAHEDNPKRLPDGLKGDHVRSSTIWDAERGSVKLTAARNEVVAFQIILEAKEPVKGVTVKATALAGAGAQPSRPRTLPSSANGTSTSSSPA